MVPFLLSSPYSINEPDTDRQGHTGLALIEESYKPRILTPERGISPFDPRVREVRCSHGPQLEAPATHSGLGLGTCHFEVSSPNERCRSFKVQDCTKLNHHDATSECKIAKKCRSSDD
ncbi:hypothetical protein FOTG_09848 [Fusarium oxysporum f. sp. vasinfectum 25433]|uniref:Uncharacterized protein n=1 Tax=Fusarium oxysporum f. sp. vasinfectum 25433 TaxID=1089449 RepID=X0LNQ5_FUSOX|nr:hypothetical protein FOTG_09848 [Fusarium oxysporum f. sp. vasinfectum 25433]